MGSSFLLTSFVPLLLSSAAGVTVSGRQRRSFSSDSTLPSTEGKSVVAVAGASAGGPRFTSRVSDVTFPADDGDNGGDGCGDGAESGAAGGRLTTGEV